MHQARYLEGGPLMWMLPLYLHVNQKSDDDDDDDDFGCDKYLNPSSAESLYVLS